MLNLIYILLRNLKELSDVDNMVRIPRGGSPCQTPASQTVVKAGALHVYRRWMKECRLGRHSKCQNCYLVINLVCIVPVKLLGQGRGYTFFRINILLMYLHVRIFVMIYAWTAQKIYATIAIRVKEHTKGYECNYQRFL